VNSYGLAVDEGCGGIREMPFLLNSLAAQEVSCDIAEQGSTLQIDGAEKTTNKRSRSWFEWLF
jgi:hypothetical protein